MNKSLLYKIIITKDPETGLYVVEVPSLSPCITFGQTVEEAIAMVQEAIDAVLESRLENGFEIPNDVIQVSTKLSPIEIFVNHELPLQTT